MTPEAIARNLLVHCCCIDRLIYLFSSYFYFKTYFNNIHNLSCSVLFEGWGGGGGGGGGVFCVGVGGGGGGGGGGGVGWFMYWPRSGHSCRVRCLLEVWALIRGNTLHAQST